MPKARARRATSPPMRPAPTSPRVLRLSSTPASPGVFQVIPRTDRSAATTFRASARMRAKVSSAAETVLPAGAFRTGMPRSVAASRSMLSTPAPARPMTFRRGAASIRARVTRVALRTMTASARVIASSFSAGALSASQRTSKRSSPVRAPSPECETLSATPTTYRRPSPLIAVLPQAAAPGVRAGPPPALPAPDPVPPPCGLPCGRCAPTAA